MKNISTLLNKKIATQQKENYSDLVQKVSKLINRPYPATLRMVEKWEPGELQALYDDCMTKWKNRGFKSPSHMFFTERKRKLGRL